MTTTTMDPDMAPIRANRRTPPPMTWDEHEGLEAIRRSASRRRVELTLLTQAGPQTSRGRPPSPTAALDRFVSQVMWCLFAVALVRCFGLDLLRMAFHVVTG